MTAVVRDVSAHCPNVSTINSSKSFTEAAEAHIAARSKLFQLTPQPEENQVDAVLIALGGGRLHLIT
jgi:hypothetical protein